MPIYEFYCQTCNTLYTFLSRSIQPSKRPPCPRCKTVQLERQVSLFAAIGHAKDAGPESADAGGADDLPIDEGKMERAMDALARDADALSDEDPRQAAGLMRKFSKMTGLELGAGMQEALNRLESGEDPDAIEAALGDQLEAEDPFVMPDKDGPVKVPRRRRPPRRDGTLYEL